MKANWCNKMNVWGELGGWNGWRHTVVPQVQFVVLLYKVQESTRGMGRECDGKEWLKKKLRNRMKESQNMV